MFMLFGVARTLVSRRSQCQPPFRFPCGRRFFQQWKRRRNPRQVADELHVPLRSVQRLYHRFDQQGEGAIVPAYDHCGQNHPNRTSQEILDKAQRLRDKHARWGAELIRLLIPSQGGRGRLPTARTLQRHFRRQCTAPAPAGRKPQTDPPRATRPHEVWQVDASEQMKLKTGRGVSWLRIVDEFSGAVLDTRAFEVSNFNTVSLHALRNHLRRVFSRWGRPAAFRVDNGFPFGSHGDFPPELSLWVLGLGIEILWNPVHTPQNNGVVERSQGVGKNWTEPEACASARQLQKRLQKMDRIQREAYPRVQGASRCAAYPELAHSGRLYSHAWEQRHWSYETVLKHLSGYLVSRKASPSGHVSLYSHNYYVGQHHRGESIFVYLDPDEVRWVFTSPDGRELRTHAAHELSRRRILKLNVTYRRPSRRQPK